MLEACATCPLHQLGEGQGRGCECSRQATLRILPRFIARMCEGGESVSNGKTATACSYCTNGICRGMEACEHRPA